STPVPSSFPVGTVLPTIKVNLFGKDGNILTNDSTDRISMVTGGIFGTLTVTAQNGVATFNDLVIGGKSGLDAGTTSLTLNFIYADLPLGGVNSSPITLTAGKAAGLAFVNPLIGTPVNPSDPNTVTTAQAGTLLRDSKNNPIQVKVIDK